MPGSRSTSFVTNCETSAPLHRISCSRGTGCQRQVITETASTDSSPGCVSRPGPRMRKPAWRQSDGWLAGPAGPKRARSWQTQHAAAGGWPTPSPGFRWPVATRSCRRGYFTNSPRRGGWSAGYGIQLVETPSASGAGTGMTPARNSPAGSASTASAPNLRAPTGARCNSPSLKPRWRVSTSSGSSPPAPESRSVTRFRPSPATTRPVLSRW